MKEAGCDRIFFGIESGNDRILKLMNKKITVEAARKAVNSVHEAGILKGQVQNSKKFGINILLLRLLGQRSLSDIQVSIRLFHQLWHEP